MEELEQLDDIRIFDQAKNFHLDGLAEIDGLTHIGQRHFLRRGHDDRLCLFNGLRHGKGFVSGSRRCVDQQFVGGDVGPQIAGEQCSEPLGTSRAELPVIAPVEGETRIAASIYQPVGDAFLLGSELETAGWPKVIQTLDPPRLATLAGYDDAEKVFPYSLRLGEAGPGALIRYWPVISTTPEKHRGYAVQWFLMATALLALYLYYSTRDDSTDNSRISKQTTQDRP